eukprot:12582-Pyramimonas_sp.AAC.1
MVRLRDTKSQHQTGAGEFVMVRSKRAVRLLLEARRLRLRAPVYRGRQEQHAIAMSPAAFHR